MFADVCLRADEAMNGTTGRRALAADDLQAKRAKVKYVSEPHDAKVDDQKSAANHDKRKLDVEGLSSEEQDYAGNGGNGLMEEDLAQTEHDDSDKAHMNVSGESRTGSQGQEVKVITDDDITMQAKIRSQQYCNPLLARKIVSEGTREFGFIFINYKKAYY